MFSGIIREVGVVKKIERFTEQGKLFVSCSKDFRQSIKEGDSIAVSGVCLTVIQEEDSILFFDIASETLRKTTLGGLQSGSKVHLESSLRVGDSVDGHFVLGHVDEVAKVVAISKEGETTCFVFTKPESIAALITEKGSIAINGVSLTVGKVSNETFSVYLIPYTLAHTTFAELKVGDMVNCEADSIARYVESIMKAKI